MRRPHGARSDVSRSQFSLRRRVLASGPIPTRRGRTLNASRRPRSYLNAIIRAAWRHRRATTSQTIRAFESAAPHTSSLRTPRVNRLAACQASSSASSHAPCSSMISAAMDEGVRRRRGSGTMRPRTRGEWSLRATRRRRSTASPTGPPARPSSASRQRGASSVGALRRCRPRMRRLIRARQAADTSRNGPCSAKARARSDLTGLRRSAVSSRSA
jgi:hypothetical protein